MKQATVAGITVALGPVLQGCGGEENESVDCGTLDPQGCIIGNGECHWDNETVEEQCNLQENFDEALFDATKPANIDEAPGALTFEGCADYDAVVAQRCVSVCEIDYNLPENESQGRSEDENLLYKEMCTEEIMFRSEIMIFPLPIVSEDLETIAPNLTGEEIYQDVADLLKPDWTAYGNLADPRLRLTAEILQGKVSIANNTEDRRRVENASVDENWEIALRPTQAADGSGRHLELGGLTLAQYQEAADAAAGSDASQEVALEQHFIRDVFPDKAEDFAKGVLLRFQVLDKLAEKGEEGVNSDKISIVQADLENSSFAWDEAFGACNLDRNCGFDYSTGKCAKVADYCASFSFEDCPDNTQTQADGVDPYDVMTYQTDVETDLQVPEAVDVSADSSGIMREYKGYVEYKETVSKCSSYTDGEVGHCAAPDEYVACEALGFVTEQSGDPCVQYDLKPTPWEARTYSEDGSFEGYDPETFDTFATYYEILVDGMPEDGLNPRGCLTANSQNIDGNYYLNGPLGSGPFGYIGPVCTLPQDWDCTINTEAENEPGCNVNLAEICEYIEPSTGQCMLNSDFYAKYFDSSDTPLYESVTVVLSEIQEEDLDAEEEDSEEEDLDAEEEDEEMITDRIA
jgi:hypothetical protein